METKLLSIIPVIPSSDVERDKIWYKEQLRFEIYFADNMYAVMLLDKLCIHLQWHADTSDDPLLGGSVVRIYGKNIFPLFEQLVQKGIVDPGKFKVNTPWGTNEFGFYDLNRNAIFIMEDAG